MMPFKAMRLRKAGTVSSPAVTFRGAGTQVLSNGVTSISLALPAAAAVGDLLVAIVLRRSTAAALPSGWALASSAGPTTQDGGTTNQYTDVYTKTAVSGDIAGGPVAFGQASSGRMQGQMLAIYRTGGTPTLESQSTGAVNNSAIVSIAVPTLTSLGGGRLGIAVASSIFANTSPSTTSYTATASWALQTTDAVIDLRFGAFSKALANGDSTAATMTTSSSLTTNGMTANALIFAP